MVPPDGCHVPHKIETENLFAHCMIKYLAQILPKKKLWENNQIWVGYQNLYMY